MPYEAYYPRPDYFAADSFGGCWTNTCVNFTVRADEIAVLAPVFGSG